MRFICRERKENVKNGSNKPADKSSYHPVGEILLLMNGNNNETAIQVFPFFDSSNL